MKKSFGIYIFAVLALLPALWLLLTLDLGGGVGGALIVAGTAITYGLTMRALWYAHRRGRFLANRCATCDHPMRALEPGALKAPGQSPPPTWRCTHCGRLV